MEITNTKEYFLITSTEEESFESFFKTYNSQKVDFEKNHTIIQLSENLNTTVNDLSLFLNIANSYRK